jgi:hypothetical protein
LKTESPEVGKTGRQGGREVMRSKKAKVLHDVKDMDIEKVS